MVVCPNFGHSVCRHKFAYFRKDLGFRRISARAFQPYAGWSMDRQVPETPSLPPVVCRLVRHHRSLKDAELLLAGLPQLVFLLRTHCVGRKCVNGGVPRVLNGSSRPQRLFSSSTPPLATTSTAFPSSTYALTSSTSVVTRRTVEGEYRESAPERGS